MTNASSRLRSLFALVAVISLFAGVVPANAQLLQVSVVTLSGPTQIEINLDYSFGGRLTLLDVGVPETKVEITVDGAVKGSDHTDANGVYSVPLSFIDYGSHSLQAIAHRDTVLEARSEILRVEAIAPSQETTTTDIAEATTFIYEGPNAVQQGVAEGTIEPLQAAVLRGAVTTATGQPVSGVKVTVPDEPEFGSTTTNEDAVFDMVVNGGDYETLRFEKGGFLPVERELDVSVRDYEVASDVVLTPLDPQVTTVDLETISEVAVARGSAVTDEAGTRQATLLFEPGTSAVMELPDGSTRALSSLDVRATEYTVGGTGEAAMPGELPSTSGYTYAVEYSVDEALEAGATDVRFSKPVSAYTDNFLGFPVGEDVPVGYYDRETHAWIPSEDGRVIEIVSESLDGRAEIDIDGDGVAEAAWELASISIDDAERVKLAELYNPGKELWRVEVTHFTPWDCNWPYGPEQGARGPGMDGAEAENQDGQCTTGGSIVGCENQTLGEQIPVAGTPYSLTYDSSRVPGFKAGHSLDIPLTDADPPDPLKRVELEVDVAGRRHRFEFEPQANLRHLFTWDGKDAYGRTVQGTVTAKIRIGYVFNAVYYSSGDQWQQSFGQAGDQPLAGNRARREVTIYQEYDTDIGSVTDLAAHALGGWSLSVHHSYDPADGKLYLGTGETHSADAFSVQIATAGGNGQPGAEGEGTYTGDGGPAKDAGLSDVRGVATAADGSVYLADSGNAVVRRIGPTGNILTFAGGGTPAGNGDGGPAAGAELEWPTDVALASDGSSLYILDTGSADVRRVDANGTITTVAGGGVDGLADEGPATEAELYAPKGIGVGPEGALYIADTRHHRVRKVLPDGSITTVAGGGSSLGDDGPATAAKLSRPNDVAVGPDGSLYISDTGHRRIRRVTPDGTISTIAGTGEVSSWSGGDRASDKGIAAPAGLIFDASTSSVYFAERPRNRIARVSTDGLIYTVAGTGTPGFAGDGGLPSGATLDKPRSVALAPDGKVYVADTGNFRLRRIIDAMPGFSATDILVPSGDGAELYQFDKNGRHLRTLEALTGTAVHTFDYDGSGRLTAVRDGYDNATTVQRDAGGAPTAIVSPFGVRTELTLNTAGFISRIVNGANEPVDLTYKDGGLLETFVTPRATHTFTYNALGRLTKDEGPDGWSLTLNRNRLSDGFEVITTTAEGLETRYASRRNKDGTPRRSVTDPTGGTTTTTVASDGTVTTTLADGTKTTAKVAPDPRWGLAAPILSSLTLTTPGGRTSTVTGSRTVSLADPDNPLTLTAQTDTLVSNNNTTTRAFSKPALTTTTTTPEGRQGVVTLNDKARVTNVQAGSLAPVAFDYDARGRVQTITHGTGVDARTTVMTYDASSFVKDVIDPRLDKTTFSSYDNVGRLKEATLADNNKIGFNYDTVGNLGSLTPPGRPAHAFDHYASDLLKTYTAPDLGDGTPRTTTYSYDLDRRPDVIDPPGAGAMDFGYDSAGRLASTAFSGGSISYSYVAQTMKLQSVTAPGGESLTYGYDGPLVTSIGASGTSAGTVGYGYDADLRVSSRTLNGGNAVSYGYDKDGFVTAAGGMTLAWDAANAHLNSTTLGAIGSSHTYNAFGEPNSDKTTFTDATAGTSTLYDATYDSRDKLGRITSKTETVGGVTSVYAYSYDNRGRLTEVTKDGAAWRHYEYDANGNRTSATDDGTTVNGSYDAQDRLTSYGNATYTYTPDGQLRTKTLGGQTTTYTYDELGSLTKVELPDKTIDYVVDGLGRRIARKVDGAITDRFVYGQGIQPIAELSASGGIKSQFVYTTRSHVPDLMIRNGTTYRFITDQVGSVRMVVNTTDGTVEQQIEHDPFGRVLSDTNPGFQPFGFAGGLDDHATGLVRFGARDYDAIIGRWTAKDPIRFDAGDTNLYAYAAADPVNFLDPSGLFLGAIADAFSRAMCWISDHSDILKDVMTGVSILTGAVVLGAAVIGTGGLAGVAVASLASISGVTGAVATAIECTDGGGLDAACATGIVSVGIARAIPKAVQVGARLTTRTTGQLVKRAVRRRAEDVLTGVEAFVSGAVGERVGGRD